VGDNGVRTVDPDGIRAIAKRLSQAAEEADEVAASMPAFLDAGPFTPFLLELVHLTAAEHVLMVMRAEMASEKLKQVAANSERFEDAASEHVDKTWKDLLEP
jgi:hypothetical protein